MKHIPLTRGLFSTVDDADFENLMGHRWCANRIGGLFYAVRGGPYTWRVSRLGRRYKYSPVIYMHRVIAGASEMALVDHRDGNGLNNQRGNLRLCSKSENNTNRAARRADGIKGITFDQTRGQWQASVSFNNRHQFIGRFMDKETAVVARRSVARIVQGAFYRPDPDERRQALEELAACGDAEAAHDLALEYPGEDRGKLFRD